MPIRVDAYTAEGVASGLVARGGHLRDVLEGGGHLVLERASWRGLTDPSSQPAGEVALPMDDVLIAVGDDEPIVPVHAQWHSIRLELGPYVVDAELPTLPGYDPGRALTRPTGEFVLLRDVGLGWLVGGDGLVPLGATAHVNRYAVDRVTADLMLGFYFPGAALDAARVPAGGAPADALPATAPA